MSWQKKCKYCEGDIFMTQINGIWIAFEDSTSSTHHRCSGIKPSNTLFEKYLLLEKIVRKQSDQIYLLQEKIDELSKGRI